jgi:hypothetical protein
MVFTVPTLPPEGHLGTKWFGEGVWVAMLYNPRAQAVHCTTNERHNMLHRTAVHCTNVLCRHEMCQCLERNTCTNMLCAQLFIARTCCEHWRCKFKPVFNETDTCGINHPDSC